MAARGVTRPMGLREIEGATPGDHDRDDGHDPEQMMLLHHRNTLWVPWTLMLLGLWLLVAPATFGYTDEANWATPSGGRGVWFSDVDTHDSLRASLLMWSDLVSGALLVLLGWRALRPSRPYTMWAACLVGVWLVLAPVVLWAPSLAGYVSDSLVGMLVIALTILIPGMPNMVRFMEMGPDRPPDWTYNPSSWPQRTVLIGLGFAGLLASRYLAVYQLGYVDALWDPVFGFEEGTRLVLDSEMSHKWPVSDAALGTAAYTFEFLMGFMGGTSRWRTMPWMVTLFGILVIPLGLSHIALVMSQPVVVHQWCTFCLLAAALMLPMITLTADEVIAMGQHLRDAIRRGDRGGSAWKVFWLGGTAEGCTPDEGTPELSELPDRLGAVTRAMVRGSTVPWSLAVTTLLGIWLLLAPAAFGVSIRSGAADAAHIGGAVVIVASVVAFAEVVRAVRWVNLLVAPGIIAAVVFTSSDAGYATAMVITGLLVAMLSLPTGDVQDSYGRWDRLIR